MAKKGWESVFFSSSRRRPRWLSTPVQMLLLQDRVHVPRAAGGRGGRDLVRLRCLGASKQFRRKLDAPAGKEPLGPFGAPRQLDREEHERIDRPCGRRSSFTLKARGEHREITRHRNPLRWTQSAEPRVPRLELFDRETELTVVFGEVVHHLDDEWMQRPRLIHLQDHGVQSAAEMPFE